MSGIGGKPTHIAQLTKRKANGELYFRRPEVQIQLNRIMELSAEQIFSRLGLPNREHPDYLLDECLVYLVRHMRKAGDQYGLERIYVELNRRFWLLIHKSSTGFQDKEEIKDIGQDVERVLLTKIFDTDSDKGDYAQVNFGDFVVTELKGRIKRSWKRQNIEQTFERLDEPKEDSYGEQLVAPGLDNLTMEEVTQNIELIPEKTREAAILHYVEGWQIESMDLNEPTVSRQMGVSSRTIRNWFKEAKEILKQSEGGERC